MFATFILEGNTPKTLLTYAEFTTVRQPLPVFTYSVASVHVSAYCERQTDE